MCRSITEGGQRCAASTRPAYAAAPAGTPAWDKAAAEYASTPAGHEELSARWAEADAHLGAMRLRMFHGEIGTHHPDLVAAITAETALRTALDRGEQIRDANRRAAQAVAAQAVAAQAVAAQAPAAAGGGVSCGPVLGG